MAQINRPFTVLLGGPLLRQAGGAGILHVVEVILS